MLAHIDPGDATILATLITTSVAAISGAVVSIIIAIRQPRIAAQVEAVHAEVKTSNGHTLGEIVEANDLTNRG